MLHKCLSGEVRVTFLFYKYPQSTRLQKHLPSPCRHLCRISFFLQEIPATFLSSLFKNMNFSSHLVRFCPLQMKLYKEELISIENSETGKKANMHTFITGRITLFLSYLLYHMKKTSIICKCEDLLLWSELCGPPTPQSICRNPNLRCDDSWRWGLRKIIRFRRGYENGAFIMRLVPF